MDTLIKNQPSRSKRIVAWFIALLFCVLITLGLAAFKIIQIKEAIAFGESFPEQSETVTSEVVKSRSWQQRVQTLGQVVAPNVLVLKTESGGRITKLGFRPGDMVTKGQVLLQLDTTEERANYQAAKANLTLANLALKRIQKLKQNNTASQEQYDQALAQQASASASVDSLEAIMAKKRIRAPFNAQTGLNQLQVGAYLSAGSHVTTLVGQDDYIWIDFPQPASAPKLQLQDKIWLRLDTNEVDLPDNEPRSAVIIAVDSMAMAQSRNLTYRAKLNTAGLPEGVKSQLLHNAVVTVEVPKGDIKDAIVIDKSAVKRDISGSYVFELIDAEQASKDGIETPKQGFRAKKTKVTLSAEQNRYVVVTSGLQPDTLIAVKGAFKLRDGLLVYLHQNTADVSQ